MKRVLLVGYDPASVDFSDPALPPGMTIEKINAGVQMALEKMTDNGWDAEVFFIQPDQTAGPALERHLGLKGYDCVVIGAGVRLPPKSLGIFEVLVNTIRKVSPASAIAFNSRPEDSADAAGRWIPKG